MTSGTTFKLQTMRLTTTIVVFLISSVVYSQDSTILKVHFLYGSKPLKEYKATEQKWFGGMLGGHVGIEEENDRIINFLPKGKFHWIAKNKNRHSTYAVHSVNNFYGILGGNPDSVKKMVVYIPVSLQQKKKFDSITNVYLSKTPYDYALIGMRCGAATYDILGQSGILPKYNHGKIYRKIFYPKKLRKLLIEKASEQNWIVVRQEGSLSRKWEKD